MREIEPGFKNVQVAKLFNETQQIIKEEEEEVLSPESFLSLVMRHKLGGHGYQFFHFYFTNVLEREKEIEQNEVFTKMMEEQRREEIPEGKGDSIVLIEEEKMGIIREVSESNIKGSASPGRKKGKFIDTTKSPRKSISPRKSLKGIDIRQSLSKSRGSTKNTSPNKY